MYLISTTHVFCCDSQSSMHTVKLKTLPRRVSSEGETMLNTIYILHGNNNMLTAGSLRKQIGCAVVQQDVDDGVERNTG